MASVSSGIRRKVDDLGRVVIPAGIRRSLNIREGDAVEVSVDGERIVLTKPRDACVFCGREGDDLHRFRSRLLCRECVSSVGRMDGELHAGPTPAPDPAGQPPASRTAW